MSRTSVATLLLATTVLSLTGCAPGALTIVAPTAAAPAASNSAGKTAEKEPVPAATATSAPNQAGRTTGGPGGSANLGGAIVSDNGGKVIPAAKASAAPTAPSAAADAARCGGPDNRCGGANDLGAPGTVAQPSLQQPQTSLKAGAIDDNAKFQEFLSYLKSYTGPKMRPYDVSDRRIIQVRNSAGRPMSNVKVSVAAGEKTVFEGRTYANGQVLFHAKTAPGSEVGTKLFVTAGEGQSAVTTGFDRNLTGNFDVKLDLITPAVVLPTKLDIQFIVDTTGSMGGEIKKLQDTINAMASRIAALPGAPATRFGLVAYKDVNSEYLTQNTEFTTSVPNFKSALDALSAGGGGDIPEDLESALTAGLAMKWDTAAPIRLTFVVTDAAPHIDYAQTTPYTTSIGQAAAKGIKYYPIGTSGLTPDGEYALRQMAQATLGQYLFITRGGDEFTGGGEVSATVDKFKEGKLDDIVVDIVKAEIAALGGQ